MARTAIEKKKAIKERDGAQPIHVRMYKSFKSHIRSTLGKYHRDNRDCGVWKEILEILSIILNSKKVFSHEEAVAYVDSLCLSRVNISSDDRDDLIEKVINLQRVVTGDDKWKHAITCSEKTKKGFNIRIDFKDKNSSRGTSSQQRKQSGQCD